MVEYALTEGRIALKPRGCAAAADDKAMIDR
jgi:hypothetical protein